MRSNARVVIIGGGVMGVSLLYHLVEEGWSDVVLIEKGELTSGSTWHAAGQCPNFVGSINMARINQVGIELYPTLEAKTGEAVSWHGCGGIRLAISDDEVDWFKYVHSMSKLVGYEAHLIGPDEIKEHHPHLETFGVKMGFLTVNDGHVAPADVTNSMAAGARQGGATIYRRCQVHDIKRLPSGEWKIFTENGDITCQHVVNAAGSYSSVVAGWTGHITPMANALHHYVITDPLQQLIDLEKELPVVRDPYSHSYLREETNGILVGPYETEGAHICWNGEAPTWDFESELLTPELDRLLPWLEKATERMPLFGEAGIKSIISGAITHTPDAASLLGPAHGPANYWMACGASIGIGQGAGSGKYLAQWMVHGAADINMAELDPRRYDTWADGEYSRSMAVVDYQHMYYCYRPGEQHNDCRPLRTSTLYERLKAKGAQFQQVFGWERPRWYDDSGAGEDYSFRRSNWWGAVKAECQAVRERVGLMDLSTFAKFEVTGADADEFLNRICANRIPQKNGGVILGHLLTENGRMEAEITVTRLAQDKFYVLSAATAQLQDYDHLSWRLEEGEDVTITDVTNDYGVLVLSGPRARDVLSACTDCDLSNDAFRWLTGKETEVVGVKAVRLLRVSYVGELGWELHIPMHDMPQIFEALMSAGDAHGIKLFGTYAMNSLRMEKAYRGWGAELTAELTMIEADMERFCHFDKEFQGKTATLKSQQDGPRSKLVYLAVDADDSDCRGNEPVYVGDRIVGLTTSGGYGHSVEQSLAFAYVEPQYAVAGQEFEVEIYSDKRPAIVLADPVWDPKSARLRG